MLADRLAGRSIVAAETLYIGNDPLQDILPAAAVGFATALYVGQLDSHRHGSCEPDISFHSWRELDRWIEGSAAPSANG